MVVGLFGDHEVVRIQHPVLGVFQQSAHLFFAEDHFPRIGLLRLGGVLVQFAQLFEPPVGVGAHRAEFQEVENPVVAADALRFVDHRSGAVEFDGCRHDDQQRREQEDRRERCRDVEDPFPERHAENLHFGAVLRDGLVREGVVAHELQHAQEILPRHVSRNGAVHPCAQVFAAFPFGQFPRGDEHDAPARPRIEEPDIGEVGGRVALFVEDERMIRPERRQRAHRRADVPHDVHPAFDHFREAGRVAAFAFDVDDGVFQSRIFLMRILSSCGLNGLTM